MLWWLLELLGRASLFITSAGSPRASHAGARPMDAVRGFPPFARFCFYRWPALAGREWPTRAPLLYFQPPPGCWAIATPWRYLPQLAVALPNGQVLFAADMLGLLRVWLGVIQ